MATNWTLIISKIDEAIAARIAGGAVQEWEIRGRNIKYATLKELQELRDWAGRKLSSTKGGVWTYGVAGRPGT